MSDNMDFDPFAWVAIGKALAFNQTLTTLDLSDSEVGSEGVIAIGKALAFNQTLTTLDLENCGAGNDGASAIATSLTWNSTLTYLDLERNGVTEHGILQRLFTANPALNLHL